MGCSGSPCLNVSKQHTEIIRKRKSVTQFNQKDTNAILWSNKNNTILVTKRKMDALFAGQ
jgi:hypothetical protein